IAVATGAARIRIVGFRIEELFNPAVEDPILFPNRDDRFCLARGIVNSLPSSHWCGSSHNLSQRRRESSEQTHYQYSFMSLGSFIASPSEIRRVSHRPGGEMQS